MLNNRCDEKKREKIKGRKVKKFLFIDIHNNFGNKRTLFHYVEGQKSQ